ncbi:hypothetical protein Dcar01_00220 [Deinococcus carri]|uniref:META domain-containing protein n=1 Tax=Deinococcus carri TaxID=1211323 RepID=A0ABP9W2B9_9DEIO
MQLRSLSPLLLLSALALAGNAGAQTPALTGTAWTLTGLTEDGRTLTPGRSVPRPTLRLDERMVSGSTGCNVYRGAYATRGDLLRFGPLATTRRACPDRVDGLEARFLNLLRQVGHYRLSGGTLTLFSGSQDRLVFTASSAAAGTPNPGSPTRPEAPMNALNLDGTWTLTGGTALRPASGNGGLPALTFAGGRVSGTTGCNRLTGDTRLSGDTLTFGPLATTRMLCAPDMNVQEQAFLAFLRTPLRVRVQGQTLTLTNAAGRTLAFTRTGTASGTPQTGGQTQANTAALEGRYTLATVNGEAAPRTAQPITLFFQGGRIGGSDGCNGFGGGYTLDGSRLLLVGPLASTLRACLDPAETVNLPALLNARPTLSVSPGGLTVVANGTTLVFTRDAAAQGRVQMWTVAPQRVPCTGVAPMSCLRVQRDGGPWELFYGEIEGFTFQPGVTQVIRVREEDRSGPVPADISSKRYVLVEVVERR